ncbi:MAG: phosphate acyltransferase [Bacteroidia bacterium]
MGGATFIFPDIMSGNIAYKLMDELAEFELIRPNFLLGMKKWGASCNSVAP